MTPKADHGAQVRTPLNKERVFNGAVSLADERGIEALTMRNLAEELGVEAMSLYYHVANKEAVLDGLVVAVLTEIGDELGGFQMPVDPQEWKSAVRHRILTARSVLLRHPWAPDVIETRTSMSPEIMLYFEGLLGILREGGFSYDLAHHAMHALGSRALGFTQELFAPDDETAGDEMAEEMLAQMAEQLPYLTGMMIEIAHDDPDSTLGWCDDDTEFQFGLDLILDGLERQLETT
ncbi:MAG: TetR/AcrR family transcriptional regulator C-terminal domain-containing protein [Actinomycetota bacterium]